MSLPSRFSNSKQHNINSDGLNYRLNEGKKLNHFNTITLRNISRVFNLLGYKNLIILSLFGITVLIYSFIFLWKSDPKTIGELILREKSVLPTKKYSHHAFGLNFHAKNYISSHKGKDLKPVLFKRHKIVSNWNAMRKWTPDSFCLRNFHLYGVYENSEKTFLFHSDRPLSKYIWQKQKQPFSVRNDIPICDFLNVLKNPNEKYMYLSQKLQYFGRELDGMNHVKESFLDDLEPSYENFFASETGRVTNIWFGGRNTTAQCHYDVAHNFFTQIYGKKHFYLFEPTAWEFLYIYPSIHPSYRQSQLNFDASVRDSKSGEHIFNTKISFQEFLSALRKTSVKIYDIVVEPGDVLYIPPYWFHHVESVGTSFSVNMWSDCDEFFISDSMLSSPLPFESTWTLDQNLEGVYNYIRLIVAEIFNIKDPTSNLVDKWINTILVKNRYEPLFNADILPKETYLNCYNFNPDVIPRYQSYVKSVASKAFQLRTGTKEIIIGNYIEELLQWSMSNTPEYIGAYLKKCFTKGE